INPYALGFAMMQDIRRVCEKPTDEDRRWLPDIAGANWLETMHEAMRNFRDESFVMQFLSPHVMRQFHLFSLHDNDHNDTINVSAIHDESGYELVRDTLSKQYNLSDQEPDIQVYQVDFRGDRSLTLRHYQNNRRPLGKDTKEVLKHVHRLWGYDVHLESLQAGAVVETQTIRKSD
ncbi:MAG TPA: SpoVR family protein, partial [Thiothrix sp.]|nr:SpoVR family protein [Thiothrix sp.]